MSNNNPGCLGRLLHILGLQSGHDDSTEVTQQLPYRVRDDFLSPAERSFFGVIYAEFSDDFVICPKVRLGDIFFVSTQEQQSWKYWNKINQKHVDFLLCDIETVEPQLAIELDDSSHNRSKRTKRDAFVDDLFAAANLPLLRVPAQRDYDTRQLALQITQTLVMPAGAATTSEPASDDTSDAPLCPKCGVPMVLRTARRGHKKGNQFYGCPNYPKCRETKPLS